MNKLIKLFGTNYIEDKAIIENSIKENPIYIFDNRDTPLYAYIDYLYFECGMKNKMINRFKVCEYIQFGENVTLLTEKGQEICKPKNIEELLEQLQIDSQYRIVIENDNRTLLANIIQQLIYIDYPITEINFNLRREYKDAAKTKRFMQSIGKLYDSAKDAVRDLNQITVDENADNKEELVGSLTKAVKVFEKILEQIEKAKDVEMKVAIAASKKTGKSVIANCMFGMELAPTSLELATPNSCVYKKSQDDKYHLTYKGHTEDFFKPDALFKRIQVEFKKAQADVNNHFTIPDMEISYVSNKNNFEAYTVYDTPGPDATGTNHKESAIKAINLCDVAIFAIDYSKYLTKDEEEYLKQIKTLFETKHKFHTLVFVINKMDLALNDKEAKSRIKSIDFIRKRLCDIDEHYKDCVIFATSAQDYFYSLELLQAAHEDKKCSVFLDSKTNLYTELRGIKEELEEEEFQNEELINVLSNLDAEVGKIKSQLGYKSVTIQTLQNYSGVPQLMNYVSYIAKNKAREEIVNSLTYTIDEQYKSLQVVINKIANIEAIMGRTQKDISQISKIINNYSEEIKLILNDNLTQDDRLLLKKNGWLDAQINKNHNNDSTIKLSEILQTLSEDSKTKESEFQKEIWEQIENEQRKLIRKYQGQIIDVNSLVLNEEQLQKIILNYFTTKFKKQQKDKENEFEKVIIDLQNIISGRFERINQCSQKCQKELEKNNCHLELPELPVFDVIIPMPELDWKIGHIEIDYRDFIQGFKPLNNVHQFLRNFISGEKKRKEVKVKKGLTEKEIKNIIKVMHEDVCTGINSSGLYNKYLQCVEGFYINIAKAETTITEMFKEVNDNCQDNINMFKDNIDDRERYRDQLESLETLKSLIYKIQNISHDFQIIWDEVVKGENTNVIEEVIE